MESGAAGAERSWRPSATAEFWKIAAATSIHLEFSPPGSVFCAVCGPSAVSADTIDLAPPEPEFTFSKGYFEMNYKAFTLIAALGLAAPLIGCDDDSDAEDMMEETADSVGDAAHDAGDAMGDAAEEAEDEMDDAKN